MYVDNGDGPEPQKSVARKLGITLLALLGIALLFPGACGAFFILYALTQPSDPYMGAVWVVAVPSLLLGVLGYWILRRLYLNRKKAGLPE